MDFIISNQKRLSVKLQRLLMIMVAIIVASMTITACHDDENDEDGIGDEKPGQISGFGENKGKISGKAFELPNGVVFDGDIWGSDWTSALRSAEVNKSGQPTAHYSLLTDELTISKKGKVVLPTLDYSTLKDEITTRSVVSDLYKYEMYGSGNAVLILIPLKNTTSSRIDVEFPAGLIFESTNAKYQHGILIKKTKVSVPSGSTYTFILMLYCGNANRDMPDTSAKYLKPVVTNSKLLLHLCDLVKNKRINAEENNATWEEWGKYMTIATKLQEIVWKVTDYGQVLDKSDLDYIAGLP